MIQGSDKGGANYEYAAAGPPPGPPRQKPPTLKVAFSSVSSRECACGARPSRIRGTTARVSRLLQVLSLGIFTRNSAGYPARTDPDAAWRSHHVRRAAGRHPFARAATIGMGKLDHRRVRIYSEAVRLIVAGAGFSGWHRRTGVEFCHLFAAAREPQPYRLQRIVAVAIRKCAGASLRRNSVLPVYGRDRGGRRARASCDS